MNKTTFLDESSTVLEVNNFMARALMPVTIYLGLIFPLGVTGNVMVLVVYALKFRKTTSTILILWLAAFDLLTCVFGIPYHFLSVIFPIMFYWVEICKMLSFVLFFTVISSVFILNLIAYDRYKKICKPLETHMSLLYTQRLCGVAVMIAGVLSLPVLFIYGNSSEPLGIGNATGTGCFIADEFQGTIFHQFYDILILVIYVVLIVVMVIMYIRIGRAVWKLRALRHKPTVTSLNLSETKERENQRENLLPTNDSRICSADDKSKAGNLETRSDDADKNKDDSGRCSNNYDNKRPKRSQRIAERYDSETDTSKSNGTSSKSTRTQNKQITKTANNSNSRKLQKKLRITLMLFVITVIFIISFLPFLVVGILGGAIKNFWKDISIPQFVANHLMLRMYLISNMSNPIVYWFLNKQFKDGLKQLMNNFFNRKCGR